MKRNQPFINGEIYHVMNKSIAGYKIFHGPSGYERMRQLLRFYSYPASLPKFSQFLAREEVQQRGFEASLFDLIEESDQNVQIIAYCLMPTHVHVVVKQLKDMGISMLMSHALNSYARYFNIKHKRQGPLWAGRFKGVRVGTDEQLSHLTRYVHLNPVTAHLCDKPEEWEFSSYHEFISTENLIHPLCNFKEFISFSPQEYRSFVEENVENQRELAEIKQLVLE